MRAFFHGVGSRVVRHEALPQEQAHTQPRPARHTCGWWLVEVRYAVRVVTHRP
jgi:hypothetical protein